MSKKKVKAPTLQEYKGSPYSDYLESDLGGYHDWLQNNWESAVTAPNLSDYYEYAKQVNQPAMNDFLQGYNTQANAIASRNYNRFGGLTNTPASYTQDIYNKQMNDQAIRLASQTLSDAYSMKNTDWANQLNAFGTVNNLFNNAGQYVDQTKYIPNWQIQNMNEVNRVNAYNQNHQGGGLLQGIGNTIVGGVTGFMTGGPAGAIAGAGLGALGSALGQSNAGAYGSTLGNSQGVNWLNNKLGFKLTP